MSKYTVGVYRDLKTGRIYATVGRVHKDGGVLWKKSNHDVTDDAVIAVAKLGEMMGKPIELRDSHGVIRYSITVFIKTL